MKLEESCNEQPRGIGVETRSVSHIAARILKQPAEALPPC